MFKSIKSHFLSKKIKYETWNINIMVRYLESVNNTNKNNFNERGIFDGFSYFGINFYKNRLRICDFQKKI